MVIVSLNHDGMRDESIEIEEEDATVEAIHGAVVSLLYRYSLCVGDSIKIEERE